MQYNACQCKSRPSDVQRCAYINSYSSAITYSAWFEESFEQPSGISSMSRSLTRCYDADLALKRTAAGLCSLAQAAGGIVNEILEHHSRLGSEMDNHITRIGRTDFKNQSLRCRSWGAVSAKVLVPAVLQFYSFGAHFAGCEGHSKYAFMTGKA